MLNKCDAVSPEELAELEAALAGRFPGLPYRTMSALAGDGVDRWLQYVLGDEPAGQRIAQVDYDVYAEGESVLGWLNASIHLGSAGPCDWRAFALDLIGRIQRDLQAREAEIAHLKLQLAADGAHLAANLTASDDEPLVRGSLPGHAAEAKLLLNARVNLGPDALRAVVERCLADATGDRLTARIEGLESFAPARPRPVHRYQSVV